MGVFVLRAELAMRLAAGGLVDGLDAGLIGHTYVQV